MYNTSRNVPYHSGNMALSSMQAQSQINGGVLPSLPTGMPTGPTVSPMPTPCGLQNSFAGNMSMTAGTHQTVMDIQYTQGFLKSQIGKRVRVEFLIGTNLFLDKTGILVDVGASYILLRDLNSNKVTLADIYAIRFVEFFQ